MTTQGNGQPVRYRLDFSEKVALEIKGLQAVAAAQGRAADFRDAWNAIVQRLESDPSTFGEFVFRYNHLNQIVHVGSVYPLTVQFSYHPELRLVYIQKTFLQST